MKKAKFKTVVLFLLVLLAIGLSFLIPDSKVEVATEPANAYEMEIVNKAVGDMAVRLNDVRLSEERKTAKNAEISDKDSLKNKY